MWVLLLFFPQPTKFLYHRKASKMGCLRCFGVVRTVIYKRSAQEASLSQQHNGERSDLSAAAPRRNVACGMSAFIRLTDAVALGEGARGGSILECAPAGPAADSHPACLGRGGLAHRLDLESCFFSCLFVVGLKRVAQLAQSWATKGSSI